MASMPDTGQDADVLIRIPAHWLDGRYLSTNQRPESDGTAGRSVTGSQVDHTDVGQLVEQAAQVSLVSGDATDHEDSVLSVDVGDVDAACALARATGLLPDYDKCQAYIANVHSAFRSGS
jgi:hypothetical protein